MWAWRVWGNDMNSREIISTKFSRTAIRENLDPRNFCAIRYYISNGDVAKVLTMEGTSQFVQTFNSWAHYHY